MFLRCIADYSVCSGSNSICSLICMLVAVGSDVFYHFLSFLQKCRNVLFYKYRVYCLINPGEVGLFCCRLCFEEWCILSPFSFFKRIPHSGHWFVLGCDSCSLLLLTSREYLFLWLVSFCCGILLLQSMSFKFLPFLLLVYYLFFCWIFAVALVWCLGTKFHK